MDFATFELNNRREQLSGSLLLLNELIEQLQKENETLEGWQKKQFDDRIKVINNFVQRVIDYDAAVKKYEQMNPNAGSVQWYRERIRVAQKYVEALGGDWSTVVWGKLSDYN